MSLYEQSSPRECPRPTEATRDTSCRCYLRGPDGVRRLSPSGTWDNVEYSRQSNGGKVSPTAGHGQPPAHHRHRITRCHYAVVLRLLEQREPTLVRVRSEETRQFARLS